MNLTSRGAYLLASLLLCLSLSCTGAAAQEANKLCVGMFHSAKGFGMSIQSQIERASFDSFSIIAEMTGVLDGTFMKPGIKGTYTRDIIFASSDRDGVGIDFYAGPGLTAGYVHDQKLPLHLIAGISGVCGSRFTFDRHLTINLEIGGDLALRMSRNQRFGNIDLAAYKSGIYHIIYPQLLIHWRF